MNSDAIHAGVCCARSACAVQGPLLIYKRFHGRVWNVTVKRDVPDQSRHFHSVRRHRGSLLNLIFFVLLDKKRATTIVMDARHSTSKCSAAQATSTISSWEPVISRSTFEIQLDARRTMRRCVWTIGLLGVLGVGGFGIFTALTLPSLSSNSSGILVPPPPSTPPFPPFPPRPPPALSFTEATRCRFDNENSGGRCCNDVSIGYFNRLKFCWNPNPEPCGVKENPPGTASSNGCYYGTRIPCPVPGNCSQFMSPPVPP